MSKSRQAVLYADLRKFNPYHDSRGRFSSADGAASFTYAPGKSKTHDKAIAAERVRSNPYRYHTVERLKAEQIKLESESKKAQLEASLTPGSKAVNRVIAAAKKKVKEIDEKYRQVQEMLEYSEKYGNDNLF